MRSNLAVMGWTAARLRGQAILASFADRRSVFFKYKRDRNKEQRTGCKDRGCDPRVQSLVHLVPEQLGEG
jgi:hypothetical protein